jgi:hypothetical protein
MALAVALITRARVSASRCESPTPIALLETAMAGETPPTVPAAGEYPPLDDYEFDPDDELEPSNEFVDAVLTRAGEFALDLIE